MKKPKLIVFDLDYTLWPFWVDTHVAPPLRKREDDKIYDGRGMEVKCYEEVPKILRGLKDDDYTLAVASRTDWPKGGRQLIELMGWNKYFTYKELYPGSKLNHFKEFHKNSGIPYNEMLFFDDEHRNIVQVGKIGVTAILVDSAEGVTTAVLESGLKQFAEKNK